MNLEIPLPVDIRAAVALAYELPWDDDGDRDLALAIVEDWVETAKKMERSQAEVDLLKALHEHIATA